MTETADNTGNHAWWASPRFLLSAAAVVLLVFIGLILFITTHNADDTGAGAATPSQSTDAGREPTTAATAADLQDSVCGLDATGGVTLTTAPKDIEWEFLNGIYAPKSEEHGPGVVDPETGVRSCFSHTPGGALLAVAGLFVSGGDPQLLLDTIERQTLEGLGKDKSLANVQARLDRNDPAVPPIELEGFRLLAYSDSEATVEVVLGADTGLERYHQTQSAVVIWQNGDWYFQAPGDSGPGQVSGQISDLSGYVLWEPSSG